MLASALLLCGALTRLLSRAQSCGCEQTYMYTSYTEVPVLDPAWSRHRYRLRLYRELAHPKQGEALVVVVVVVTWCCVWRCGGVAVVAVVVNVAVVEAEVIVCGKCTPSMPVLT